MFVRIRDHGKGTGNPEEKLNVTKKSGAVGLVKRNAATVHGMICDDRYDESGLIDLVD